MSIGKIIPGGPSTRDGSADAAHEKSLISEATAQWNVLCITGFLGWGLAPIIPQRRLAVLIRVLYKDNKYDYVSDSVLDELIESGKIKQFCRTEGWVTVGEDPIRGRGGIADRVGYSGPERRRAIRAA
jgi:hypothetical protein